MKKNPPPASTSGPCLSRLLVNLIEAKLELDEKRSIYLDSIIRIFQCSRTTDLRRLEYEQAMNTYAQAKKDIDDWQRQEGKQ